MLCRVECGECTVETPIYDLCEKCTEANEAQYCARCSVAPHEKDDIYCVHCRLFLEKESKSIDAWIALRAEGIV